MKLRLQLKDNTVFPIENTVAHQFLPEPGYNEFRRAKRMRLGKAKHWKRADIYNRIGDNLG